MAPATPRTATAAKSPSRLIVGLRTVTGNSYDEHSLAAQLDQMRILLKDATGDVLPLVLCATGFNLRWLLRAIARLGIEAILLRLLRHVKCAVAHHFLTTAQQLQVGVPMRSPFRWAAALTRAIQLATRSP